MLLAKQQCGPHEEPIRNSVSGRIDIRNKSTGAIRPLFSVTPGGAPAAATLIQRTSRLRIAQSVYKTVLFNKLRTLRNAVSEVQNLVATGNKYDLDALSRVSETPQSSSTERTRAAELLLQINELVTQAMLKVDSVESQGNEIIRTHRRASVKRLLALTESIETARAKLKS